MQSKRGGNLIEVCFYSISFAYKLADSFAYKLAVNFNQKKRLDVQIAVTFKLYTFGTTVTERTTTSCLSLAITTKQPKN